MVKKHVLRGWYYQYGRGEKMEPRELSDALIKWLNENDVEVITIAKDIVSEGEDWTIIYREK